MVGVRVHPNKGATSLTLVLLLGEDWRVTDKWVTFDWCNHQLRRGEDDALR